MIDSPYLVKPGKKVRLDDWPTRDGGEFESKEASLPAVEKNLRKLDELQGELYAEGRRSLLIVFQAMDAGGKDGAISHVFSGVNPQGCQVTSFKRPSDNELAHDYLWRIHMQAPPRGVIGIFNRSHYESVLVERVRKIAPKDVWSRRFDHINAFEKLLADEGTTIIKFFLHISKEEQRERLQARLNDPAKNWKFNPGDLEERKMWDQYQDAYADLLTECSTEYAPWFIVPADRKWFRNWVLSDTIVRTMKRMDLHYPPAPAGLDDIVVE